MWDITMKSIFRVYSRSIFEVSLADLQNDEVAFRKFKPITKDVQGKKLPD